MAEAPKTKDKKPTVDNANPPAGQSDKKDPVKALEITSKQDGFRRAGRVWGTTKQTVRLDELTRDQVKQLKEEPLLTITETELEPE